MPPGSASAYRIEEGLQRLGGPEQPAGPGATDPVLAERGLNASLSGDIEQQSGEVVIPKQRRTALIRGLPGQIRMGNKPSVPDAVCVFPKPADQRLRVLGGADVRIKR